MLFVSVGFAVFFVHALITIPELFSDAYQIALNENLHLFIHLIALAFILLGILKD
jgi:Na+-translocating ferredoxin:NAD+ oxidoreductase RnfE subunit